MEIDNDLDNFIDTLENLETQAKTLKAKTTNGKTKKALLHTINNLEKSLNELKENHQ